MSKRRTLITGFVMSTLLTMGIAPVATAHDFADGSLTIYNKNCTKVIGFKKYKRVTVEVRDSSTGMRKCTRAKITVGIGQRKTIPLRGGLDTTRCDYYHRARGTVGGENDVKGTEHSSVTCKKDGAGVCQCTKD